MTDIEIFGKEFDDVVGFKMPDLLGDDVTFTEGGGGSPTLETVTKTYTPTESQQTETITASSGYDGIEEVDVTVNAVSSSYVGTGITRRTSLDLTTHEATITAPAGYYENSASASISIVTHAKPSITVNNNSGLITASHAQTQEGYIYTGVTAESSQLTTQAAQTIYPSASDQTIASGQFLTGTQTIKAVTTTNISAANIKSGVTVEVGDSSDSNRILSVTGTYVGSTNLVHYAIRPDAVLANSYTYDKYMNADESITMPSYSTSAQTIKASASLGTITLDRDNYYYYIVERMLTIPTYSVTSVAKGRCEFHMGAHVFEIIDIPANTLHSLINPSLLYTSRLNTVTTVLATYRELYYSSGTALATYSTQAYGVCQAAVAPAISSGVVTINSPTVTCRGHSTYYSSTYANALTDVRAQYVIEVYKAPKNSSLGYDGWSNDQLMKQIITAVNSNTQKLT